MTLNKVQLIGNVGSDPEIRSMGTGGKVASFSLATSERWKDKTTGEKKEKTEWHKVVIFNEGLIKLVEGYIKKGTKLYVEGQVATRKWNKDGVDIYTTEIVLKQYRGEISILSSVQGAPKDESSDEPTGTLKEPLPPEDEIPF